MASPIIWHNFPTARSTLVCQPCGTQISQGQPYLIRAFGRRYARFWCCACKAHLDASRPLDSAAVVGR